MAAVTQKVTQKLLWCPCREGRGMIEPTPQWLRDAARRRAPGRHCDPPSPDPDAQRPAWAAAECCPSP